MNPLALGISQFIGAYQCLLSPLLPPACRFWPACSEYARQALRVHGLARGLRLALLRLARCHPFSPGGYDPPPGLCDESAGG